MSSEQPTAPTVFLSYASEDREAARRIGAALPPFGLEVWYDESELGGGDAWDQKIRRQIRDCDYFMALVSAHTEARHEGYFRREWRLAVERTLDMADDHLFLLPIVIDDTDEMRARVPEKFLTVQWLRVPDGKPTPALEALCRRLPSGEPAPTGPKKPARRHGAAREGSPPSQPSQPSQSSAPPEPLPFPLQQPGQPVRFWFEVLGWMVRSSWQLFQRLPGWIRWLAIIWLAIALMSRGCTPGSSHRSKDLSPDAAKKLKGITDQYQGEKVDPVKMATEIAREFADADKDEDVTGSRMLVIPFAVPAGDDSAQRFADAAFAQVFGRIAISHSARLTAAKAPVSDCALSQILQQGKTGHARFVLCGAIAAPAPRPNPGLAPGQTLALSITTVQDGTVLWSKSYPIEGSDPAKIASEVNAKIPSPDAE